MTTQKETATTFKAAIVHAPSSWFALTRSGLGFKHPRMIAAFFSPGAFAILLTSLSDHEMTEMDETGRKLVRNQDATWVHECRNCAESDEPLESGRRDVFV